MVLRNSEEVLMPLREETIRAGLTTRRIGSAIHLLHEVDSTNDEAAALARGGEADGAIVIAEAQRRGRGRLGRQWQSPKGLGLYLSVILRPAIPPHDAPVLTLMSAVAGADAIERTTGLIAAFKWPNDLIVHGRKVGGMLGEMAVEAPASCMSSWGSASTSIRPRRTSMRNCVRPPVRSALRRAISWIEQR